MVFGTPISWFINEVIAVALFCIVTVHILKGKDPVHRLLELFFYMLTAGIFENIGVWQHIYDYSTCRIMMFGKVPIAILLVEGVILYATVELMEKVHVPGWVLPFGCGVLSSVQDMTLDPASVFDLHEIEGELEGQWNWTAHYEGGFVDIPFFNFSGWLTMMLFFMAFCMIGRNVYRKKKKEWIGYAYPVFAMLGTLILQCTVNMFLLFMAPLFPMYQKTPELIMLVVNFAVCIFLVLKYSRYDIPYDAGRDRLMFWMPAFLHIYAMVSILVLGITKAILPCAVVAILHGGYLFFAYRKIKAAGRETGAAA